MADRLIDDKTSDTLVAGLRLMVLDEEFNSPPSPPEEHSTRRIVGAFLFAPVATNCRRYPPSRGNSRRLKHGNGKRHQGRSVAAQDATGLVRLHDVSR